MYQPRHYRHWVQGHDLVAYSVVIKESDLYIRSSLDLSKQAYRSLLKYREILETYIKTHPFFAASLEPLAIEDNAPRLIQAMAQSARAVNVGPMAAVAGAMAQMVGEELAAISPEVIVENGGDIYLKSHRDRVVAIYAGNSPLSGKIGVQIKGEETPVGVCTSSGTVGPSISFGKADAAVVVAPSAILADAAATAIGNAVVTPDDIPHALQLAQSINGLSGVVIIKDDKLGVWGKLELRQLDV